MPWAFAPLRSPPVPAMNPGRQRAPRTGVVVPQGRVRKPRGSPADNRDPQAPRKPALAQPPPPTPGPLGSSPHAHPARSIKPRHRLTPLGERGCELIFLQNVLVKA